MNLLDKLIVSYLLNSNKVFFASLLTQMRKIPSSSCPTAGVTISDGQLYLLYNPDFFEEVVKKQGPKVLKGILEHEILHVVYEHLWRCKEYNRHPQIYNLATDITINQYLSSDMILTEQCSACKGTGKVHNKKCVPCGGTGKTGMLFPKHFNLPDGKDAEWYYQKIYEKAPKIRVNMPCSACGGTGKKEDGSQCPECGGQDKEGMSTIDDHSQWRKIKENKQMAKEVVKKAVEEAYKASKKMRGDLPGHLEQQIQELLKPPTIPWNRLLKQYIGASIKTGFKSSWKRPNKRFPDCEAVKGKVSKRTIRMLLAIDTSGSISEVDFEDFIIEMRGIMNSYKCKIDWVQCDTRICSKGTLKPYSKLKVKFSGRGGTEFTPVFKYLQKHPEYDLLIYFTDGYGDAERCTSNKNVIWVLNRDGYDVQEYEELIKCGVVVKIDPKKK